ncbi:MAG TPA: aldo/keto reductase [Flavisolibacter sp.]|nr:aldo/keto reductase [Flavisolibacter sp.]
MQYQQLGNSSLHISRIAFGCMSLKPAQQGNEAILHRALDLGINFFDTADLYDKGENEALLGKAFRGRRDRCILATKVGNQWRPDGSGWDWNPRKSYILRAVEESLRRLNTDYIDLYQLHGGTAEDPTEESIEAFEQLVQQGKIRYYGISSIRPNVIRKWTSRSSIASVMMQYSLLDRRPEENCLNLLMQHGIGVLARGSLAQGLLTGKTPKDYLGYTAEEVQKAAAAVDALQPKGKQVAKCIRFVLSQPAITAAVVGIRTMEQLEEAAAVPDLAIEPHSIQALADVLPPNTYTEHR